jgi:ABC-type transport system involved in cytochrome bd biosynthesis fused ATPase/permease subunit
LTLFDKIPIKKRSRSSHPQVNRQWRPANWICSTVSRTPLSLPDKFDTPLGDRGARLSGGQRQRIALARAFLREPDMIILDEATSALDTLTEQLIQQQITSFFGDKTIVVIAHRLSTVRRAHQITVLDKGRIVEKGRHNELVARRGIYSRMLQSQSLDLADDEPPQTLVTSALEVEAPGTASRGAQSGTIE